MIVAKNSINLFKGSALRKKRIAPNTRPSSGNIIKTFCSKRTSCGMSKKRLWRVFNVKRHYRDVKPAIFFRNRKKVIQNPNSPTIQIAVLVSNIGKSHCAVFRKLFSRNVVGKKQDFSTTPVF